jgi:hypothetical protein
LPLPLPLIPTPKQRFWVIEEDGVQPCTGSLAFFIAGTDTPAAVFADPEGDTSLGAVVNLDDDGYAPAIYISNEFAYKVILYEDEDAEGAQIWEVDGVEDVGANYLETLGIIQTEGSKGVETGYEVTPSDNLITVNELVTDPAVIVLQEAADRTTPLTIKNLGATEVAITPQGSDAIENVVGAYTLPAGASPNFPTITLNSDGVSTYWIMSSHGL